MLPRLRWIVVAAALVAGCGDQTVDGVRVKMDFTRANNFFDAPFPSDDLLKGDGTVDVSRFPNPDKTQLIEQARTLISRDARGFARTGAVFFSLTGAIDASSLPDAKHSADADSPVFLVDLTSSDHRRYPVKVSFEADGGPFGAPNLLSVLPVQGIPLPGRTRFAAVVRTSLRDVAGQPLLPVSFAPWSAGSAQSQYDAALGALLDLGIDGQQLAGLAVFTTGAPTEDLANYVADAGKRPLSVSQFVRTDVFDDYCVYQATVDLWDYQSGTAPYSKEGGDWVNKADGAPGDPHKETANLYVTIPRAPMPADGFPTVVFIRTGGGGDRPLVDRGVQAVHNGPPLVPGSGPAREFARVGFAGVQVDGPLGGLRNPNGLDEQFLVFNVFNLASVRDTVRESALELVELAGVLSAHVPTSDCAGAPASSSLDTSRLALMGHSMGASIAPLTASPVPLYRALVLSGAGASYIENVLWKKEPIEVRPQAENLLHYVVDGYPLREDDPALSFVQWALEPSDSQVYAQTVADSGAHTLMLQGIVDHYIMPNIANAVSVPLGLGLTGDVRDTAAMQPEYAGQESVIDMLSLVGRGRVSYPVSGNDQSGKTPRTAVVVQHPGDGIEDGHEVVFQTEPPKHQYRCFLKSFAANPAAAPTVVEPAAADAPCP